MTLFTDHSTGPGLSDAHRTRVGIVTRPAMTLLAALRIATGAVFLWAFADKTVGLHYSTAGSGAWIHGGSPTRGFLSSVDVGPLSGLFHDIAGQGWTDALFMLGLLALGVALVAGVALRPAAAAGTAILALMWSAEWPPAQHTSTGAASGSANPLIDYHVVYALTLLVLAATYAGNTWGLGRAWARLPFVSRHRWAL